MKIGRIRQAVSEHRDFYEQYYNTRLMKSDLLLLVVNPSIRAGVLFHMCARRSKAHFIWRNILIALHSCDVSQGAVFEGAVLLPHPISIVIGKSVVVGDRVVVYQGVTLGVGPGGGYPKIEQSVVLYPACSVVGGVQVAAGTYVKTHQVVSP